MNAIQRCCFVLWGEQCDEVAAVFFITTLRAMGIRVWLVGIGGKRNCGAHGLALVSDLALEQALPLAGQSMAVMIPCRAEQWVHFLNDPRLVAFIVACIHHQAPVLMAESNQSSFVDTTYQTMGIPIASILTYPSDDKLFPFIQTFAQSLNKQR